MWGLSLPNHSKKVRPGKEEELWRRRKGVDVDRASVGSGLQPSLGQNGVSIRQELQAIKAGGWSPSEMPHIYSPILHAWTGFLSTCASKPVDLVEPCFLYILPAWP